MKTKFHLRKSSKKSIINFEFRNGTNIKFRASTGFFINSEKDWDTVKQKMKFPSSTPNAILINAKLSEFDNIYGELLYQNKGQGIEIETVKSSFNKVFGRKETSKTKFQNDLFKADFCDEVSNKDFIVYYNWFLEFYSKNNSPYSKRILTRGTLRTMKCTLSILQKYLKERNLKTLYFEDINRKFYNDLLNFLNDKNYTKNYIGTVIQKIKTVMGYAFDEEKHTNLEFKKSYFSKMTEVVNHPYLAMEELKSIENLILSDSEMDVARDIFLIGCYTGLRIGDLLNFIKNPNFIYENNKRFISLRQSKTSNIVYIPLRNEVSEIMKKYNDNLPNYLHQNNINAHLKSICKRAKIDELYQYSRTKGGKSIVIKNPKYKFISTHTARRSFCTNAYNQGMPIQDIMAISGHKTERVFLNYIKVDKLQNASRISQHEFFK